MFDWLQLAPMLMVEECPMRSAHRKSLKISKANFPARRDSQSLRAFLCFSVGSFQVSTGFKISSIFDPAIDFAYFSAYILVKTTFSFELSAI
jgi:hypothetical protein